MAGYLLVRPHIQTNMENNLSGSLKILTTLNSFSSLIYLKSLPWEILAQYVCLFIKKLEKLLFRCHISFTVFYILVSLQTWIWLFLSFKKICINLFLEKGKGREKERKRNISVWLPLMCPLLGTWPATQACALTGN